MRSKHASLLMTIMQSITTNGDYEISEMPIRIMRHVAPEYLAFTAHANAHPEDVPALVASKGEALEKIRGRLVELSLI